MSTSRKPAEAQRSEPLSVYDNVRILDSDASRRLGVAGCQGTVTGIPESDDGRTCLDEDVQYAVLVRDTNYAIARRDLRPSGSKASPDEFEAIASVRVSVHGE